MRKIGRFIKNLFLFGLVLLLGYYLSKGYVTLTNPELAEKLYDHTASASSVERQAGQELVFDAAVYPYYDALNDNQKILYKDMYSAANDMVESFEPSVSVSAEDVETTFRSLLCDHPELFWLSNQYHYQFMQSSGEIVSVSIQYNETADSIDTAKQEFEAAGNRIIEEAQKLDTDYAKEKYVHDALIDQVEYVTGAPLNQSAFSALVSDQTVCAGYAKSFQYLMQKLNIPCYYVIGTSEGQDHAWNIVNIDGSFYNVDVTWDDCASEHDQYYFFNLDDLAFNQYHTRALLSADLPNCTSTLLAHLEDEDVYPYMRFSIPK